MIGYRSTHRLSASLVQCAIGWRWPLILLSAMAMVALYPVSQQLEFDRSIESLFAADDPNYLQYVELQRSFGGNAVVILVYRSENLASAEGIRSNLSLSQQVEGIEGVKGVLSPAVLNKAVEKLRPASLLSNEPALFRPRDPVAIGFQKLFAGYTHSSDLRWAGIVAMLQPDYGRETITALQAIRSAMPKQQQASLVGEPILVHTGFDLIQRDGAALARRTVMLLAIVVVISLADWRFCLLTITVVAWTVVMTKAAMVWLGIELSLVSTILTAIVMVVSTTAILHLGVRFRVFRNRGHRPRSAMWVTGALLAGPIFWTCATDAAGFAALQASRIVPIQQFGIMIAMASMIVLVGIMFMGPAIIMLPDRPIAGRWQSFQRAASRSLRRGCVRLAFRAISQPWHCIAIVAICLVISYVGMGRAEIETSFLNNFRPESAVVQDYQRVEQEFGGAGVWDIVLPAPERLNAEYLERVRALEKELRSIDLDGARLTKVLSLADADAIASRAPLARLLAPATRLRGMQAVMPVFFDALLSPAQSNGGGKLRIMLRSQEQLPADSKRRLIARVRSVVNQHLTDPAWSTLVKDNTTSAKDSTTPDRSDPRTNPLSDDPPTVAIVTGYYVLMAELVNQLLGDQWRCFLVSGIAVWALLLIATRSLWHATVAVLLNVIPILMVLSILGLLGGKINMGVAMIAAVSIGISIDGSVHFLARYTRYRLRGHTAKTAAAIAAGNVGVAVLLATISLAIGFGALSTSEFVPTATFGTLVAATLIAGTAINLTLLPAFTAHPVVSKRSASSERPANH